MKNIRTITLSFLTAASFVFAQDAPPAPVAQQQAAPDSGGWRRVGDSNPSPQNFGTPTSNAPNDPPVYNVPLQLTIKSGTFLTVRINQVLSSDHNQAGDAFTATLERPVVVDGFVVAQQGQIVAGHVTEATKAGRAKGVSHLAVQLTDLTLVDGQQAPIQSQMITRTGPTSVGRDAGAIAGTTAVGAAAGAIGAGGTGAAIGAGAGAVVGTVGVLLTRGRPTYITPESVMSFQIQAPVTVSTERAPQAFRYVSPNDYNQPGPRLQTRAPAGYGAPGNPYYGVGYPYPYAYPYLYGPGFYGPSVFFGFRGGRRW
jgi:hypothetical protein